MYDGPLGTDKDVEKIIRRARRQGWEVTVTRGNHIRVVPLDGPAFQTALTPRSSGGVRLMIKKFKRAGLK